jgi:hypothetical protein
MGTVFTYSTVFLATAPAVSSSLNAKGRDSLHEVHVHDWCVLRMALARDSRLKPRTLSRLREQSQSPEAPSVHRYPRRRCAATGIAHRRFSMVEKSVASTVHACKHRCERNPKIGKRTAPPRHPLADILANGTIHAKEFHAIVSIFLKFERGTPSEPASTNMHAASCWTFPSAWAAGPMLAAGTSELNFTRGPSLL